MSKQVCCVTDLAQRAVRGCYERKALSRGCRIVRLDASRDISE